MAFQGFGEYAVDFYDQLAEDNSKVFWDGHRQTYTEDVREPMAALLAELEPEFGGRHGSAKVFRPHRDVRFSKDKRPYKVHCGGVIEQGRGSGAFYVELSSAGLRAGGGSFHMQPDQLARYRTAVDERRRGEQLRTVLAKLERAGFTLGGSSLKTRPRGYDADHPRLELLRRKEVYAMRGWEPDDVLHERGSLARVRDAWRAVRTLNDWAADHIGPTEHVR